MKKEEKQRLLAAFLVGVAVSSLIWSFGLIIQESKREDKSIEEVIGEKMEVILEKQPPRIVTEKPDITEDFLTPNEYSRPGDALEEVNNIFIHYTANASTTAAQNRSYFENLGQTGETSASAHFIIGYEGEIVQCLPLDEIGYAVKGRNYDSISIECCYVEKDGRFTEETYQSLIQLVSWLLGEYDLQTDAVLRHYDAGGKPCPKYYVNNENKWNVFVKAVADYRKRNGVEVPREEQDESETTVDPDDEAK